MSILDTWSIYSPRNSRLMRLKLILYLKRWYDSDEILTDEFFWLAMGRSFDLWRPGRY
jgi:hypothetical protein